MSSIEPREAAHGEKMIEVRVRFWTNDLAEGGRILPKHAWSSGAVYLRTNPSHGITSQEAVMFNSLAELPEAIQGALANGGVALHHGGGEAAERS